MGSLVRAIDYEIAMVFLPAGYPHPFSPFAGAIRVDCCVTLKNTGPEPIDEATFILHRLLRVQRVLGSGGESLPFTQEVVDFEGIPNLQVRCVHVSLPKPVLPDRDFALTFCYEGVVAGHCEAFPYCKDSVNKDFALLRSDVIWYPVPACPTRESWSKSFREDNAFTYRVSVDVPTALIRNPVVVTAGDGETVASDESHAVYRYKCRLPSTRIDVVAAPYTRAHDPSGTITVFSLPGDDQAAARVLQIVERTVQLCTKWLGPVPPRRLSIAEIPDNWGSQSSPCLILQTRSGFVVGSGTNPGAGSTPQAFPLPEWRQVLNLGHEVAHLWSVSSLEAISSRFLDEGMTHFIEALLLLEMFGEEAFQWRMRSFAENFNQASLHARSQPICGNEKPEYTTVLSRGKGPWVLYALSQLIGLDATLAAMRDFTQKYLATGATPEDFVDAAASSVAAADPTGQTGAKVRELLSEWLFGTQVMVIDTDVKAQ